MARNTPTLARNGMWTIKNNYYTIHFMTFSYIILYLSIISEKCRKCIIFILKRNLKQGLLFFANRFK